MKISYETARATDAGEIAALHALSWQRHYRGIYTDQYLDHEVQNERLNVWRSRFKKSDKKQLVIKAMHRDKIIGFACTFLDADPVHGALVDNLHVLQEYQGHGIGRTLLQMSARWVLENRPSSKIHLMVLEKNYPARTFYSNLGARMSEVYFLPNPTGQPEAVIRCEWNPADLLDAAGTVKLPS